MKCSHFCDSSCIPHSFLLLPSTFVFSFAEKFDILIEFLEGENARSFLHFLVSSFKLCDKAKIVSDLSDLGLSLDLQKLQIFE